jgi:hypothetical protein
VRDHGQGSYLTEGRRSSIVREGVPDDRLWAHRLPRSVGRGEASRMPVAPRQKGNLEQFMGQSAPGLRSGLRQHKSCSE